MGMVVVQMLLGLAVLTAGAEVLVRSASALALAMRISPLVIGLTVVAYGTSTPELVVSLQSSLHGQPDIALGNVVGSNIFNVLFILGISALIIPLRVSQQLVRFDVPLMIGLSILMGTLSLDGRIGRLDGLLLVAGLIAYTTWAIVKSRKEQAEIQAEYAAEFGTPRSASTARIVLNVVLIGTGLVLLVFGSRWFTDAAITLARQWGISELVIGLTIVAAGTSLPEVATSVVAAFRGERDIAVGNVVGSNLFNIMGVLGLSSIISANGVAVAETAMKFDIPVMIAVAFACLPIFFTGHLIARWEGGLFFLYCCAYIGYLIASATNPAITRTLSIVMLGFVVPLTVVTLSVGVIRSLRQGSDRKT
jgi:cation:H+ antiporter